jgi:hypothetical protein
VRSCPLNAKKMHILALAKLPHSGILPEVVDGGLKRGCF